MKDIIMYKYELTYTDGSVKIVEFKTKEEMLNYINNEGDHLVRMKLLKEKGND